MSLDPFDLAAALIRFDTINPPGQEADCTNYLARLLTGAGFHCETVLLAEGRPNLVARIGGNSKKLPIASDGHTRPGPAHMAHQTDEWCECTRIEEAVVIYEQIIAAWCSSLR